MRISEKTLKVAGRRKRLRWAFVQNLSGMLADEGIALVELDQGYCLIRLSSLDGVKPYTISRFRRETDMRLRDEQALRQYISDLTGPDPAEVEEC